ncbi:unnamed protein product, partial [Didymodactylos carnosus]
MLSRDYTTEASRYVFIIHFHRAYRVSDE